MFWNPFYLRTCISLYFYSNSIHFCGTLCVIQPYLFDLWEHTALSSGCQLICFFLSIFINSYLMQCLKREGGEGSMLALLPQVVSGCPVKQFRFHVVLRHHNLKHSVWNNKIIYQNENNPASSKLGRYFDCCNQNLDHNSPLINTHYSCVINSWIWTDTLLDLIKQLSQCKINKMQRMIFAYAYFRLTIII